jgi:hypothetical protein
VILCLKTFQSNEVESVSARGQRSAAKYVTMSYHISYRITF